MKRVSKCIFIVLAATFVVAGCGAGAPDSASTEVPVEAVIAENLAQSCGAQIPTLPLGSDNVVQRSPASATYLRSSWIAAAGSGFDPFDSWMSIAAEIEDHRQWTPISVGYGLMSKARMGIEMMPVFGDRAVACVKKLDFSGANVVPGIDSARITGIILDGFEWLGNFVPRESRAYFSVPKSVATDGNALSGCYQPQGSSTQSEWQCQRGVPVDTGDAWFFTIPADRPGRVLLISEHPQRGA